MGKSHLVGGINVVVGLACSESSLEKVPMGRRQKGSSSIRMKANIVVVKNILKNYF